MAQREKHKWSKSWANWAGCEGNLPLNRQVGLQTSSWLSQLKASCDFVSQAASLIPGKRFIIWATVFKNTSYRHPLVNSTFSHLALCWVRPDRWLYVHGRRKAWNSTHSNTKQMALTRTARCIRFQRWAGCPCQLHSNHTVQSLSHRQWHRGFLCGSLLSCQQASRKTLMLKEGGSLPIVHCLEQTQLQRDCGNTQAM